MELGVGDMIENLPQFIEEGYVLKPETTFIEELSTNALESLKKKLNRDGTHWRRNILSCWSILWGLHEHKFVHEFEGLAQNCRDVIKAYLVKNGNKDYLFNRVNQRHI